MSKDAVIKARGEEFDAALRVELARQSVEHRRKMLDSAKAEYEQAGEALRAIRASTTALEASTVAEIGKERGASVVLPGDAALEDMVVRDRS